MNHPASQRAFTLVETIATIVILGIISAVMLPLFHTVTDAYTRSADVRNAGTRIDAALERIVRLLRDAPASGTGGADITTAQDDTLELGDGTRVTLTGSNIFLTTPTQPAALLCPDVEALAFEYVGADGTTLDLDGGDTKDDIQRVNISIRAGGLELRTAAFLRVTIGGDA